MTKNEKLYRLNLSQRAISVYLYLDDRANRERQCWPAVPTIAQDLHLSQTTVRRALHDLRSVGLVTTEQRYYPKGGKSTLLYTLGK